MRSDAMSSSFFMRRTEQHSRMDRAKSGQQSAASQGFGNAEARVGDREGFKATYNKVARENILARKITDENTSSRFSNVQARDQEEQNDPRNSLFLKADTQVSDTSSRSGIQAPRADVPDPVDPALLVSELPDVSQIVDLVLQQQPVNLDQFKVPQTGDSVGDLTIGELVAPGAQQASGAANVAAEASAIISLALTEVSQTLGLSIDPGLQKLSLNNGSGGVAEQFAEILCALKKIAGLLDGAVGQQQKIALPDSSVIDVPAARDMSAFIQVRIFRIEIGVSMLGFGEAVQNDLAAKLELTAGLNIPQALDPAKVVMSQAQLTKVFGEMFQESSQSISTLREKIRELCMKFGQQQNIPEGVSTAVRNALEAATARTAQQEIGLFSLDAQVMRKMLKIESRELLAGQNTAAAAQAGKLDLSFGVLKAGVKTAGSGASNLAAEMFPPVDASAKSAAMQILASFEAKSTAPAYRTIEESVMTQIAEKLNTAIRSGINEIRLQLRPESLGEMQLRIRVEGDVVFARIQVESQQVKQIVESNLQLLKDSLSQQNLQAGSLEVNVGTDGSSRNDGQVHDQAHNGVTVASAENGDPVPEQEAAALAQGVETGRRFGDNTVEYFA